MNEWKIGLLMYASDILRPVNKRASKYLKDYAAGYIMDNVHEQMADLIEKEEAERVEAERE